MCVSLERGDFKAVTESLPSKISLATNEPPICDVSKIVGRSKVVLFVKSELVKMSERVNVSGNITIPQLEFIATQLVEMFQNESLADFKLCFERGCIGQYGEIYRMDGIVLRKWMERYLEEKYQAVEQELKMEKRREYEQATPPTEKGPGYLEFEAHANSLKLGTKVPGMSDGDYRKYGRPEVFLDSKTAGYKYFKVHNVEVFAATQEHAEDLVKLMIERGELIEEPPEEVKE